MATSEHANSYVQRDPSARARALRGDSANLPLPTGPSAASTRYPARAQRSTVSASRRARTPPGGRWSPPSEPLGRGPRGPTPRCPRLAPQMPGHRSGGRVHQRRPQPLPRLVANHCPSRVSASIHANPRTFANRANVAAGHLDDDRHALAFRRERDRVQHRELLPAAAAPRPR